MLQMDQSPVPQNARIAITHLRRQDRSAENSKGHTSPAALVTPDNQKASSNRKLIFPLDT